MKKIKERLVAVIASETDPRKRFKQLEDHTGISKGSWTAMWHDQQRPTAEMIEAVAKLWPDYAYWLACGDTEPEFGHVAPASVPSTYPCINAEANRLKSQERHIKQQLLSQVPDDPESQQSFYAAKREEGFKAIEKLGNPAPYWHFKHLMKAFQQEAKDDLFLVEIYPELLELRIKRMKAEKDLNELVCKARINLRNTKEIDDMALHGTDVVMDAIDRVVNKPVKKAIGKFIKQK